MNLPNKLTLLRVVMIPLCLGFVLLDWYLPAAFVFALFSYTAKSCALIPTYRYVLIALLDL